MHGVAFGKKLKDLRKKAGIPSKELSSMVGKAVTYVSQLERGLIKKPDFNTCLQLLTFLGVEEQKAEEILGYYEIMSPERERAELEWASKQAEEAWNFGWIEQNKQKLLQSNDVLHSKFTTLINSDQTTAEKLLNNIQALTTSKENFSFLCSLFVYDYSKITVDDRKDLFEIIKNFIDSRYEHDEWDELVKKGGKK